MGELPKGWLGSYRHLLSSREERRNLLLGTGLAVAGVVGLWGIGEYGVDLEHSVFTAYFSASDAAHDVASQVADVASQVARAKSWAYLLQMAGGAMGMFAFTYLADRFGRRQAFISGFTAALAVTLFVFGTLQSPADAYWMMPLMGAAQFSVFAGFSIYLPELFSAAARGTAISFAYNVGRFAAAAGSFVSSVLSKRIFGGFAAPAPLRYSAMAMCSVFVIGLLVAMVAPETRGRALPE